MSTTLRADAQRNVRRILDAAVQTLGLDPAATMQDIAAAAGVGRVTIYAHYASRPVLVEAALVYAIEQGDAALDSVDLASDPLEALDRLVRASWSLSAASANILEAARGSLDAARILELHAGPAARALMLLHRGQRAGVFRSDLPGDWLITSLHALMKHALVEIAADRLAPADAPSVISATARALWQTTRDAAARVGA